MGKLPLLFKIRIQSLRTFGPAMLLGLLVLAGGCAGSKREDALERANGPVLHLSSQYVPHTLLYGVKAAACCGAIVIVLRVRALCVRCACVCIDPFLGHYPGPPCTERRVPCRLKVCDPADPAQSWALRAGWGDPASFFFLFFFFFSFLRRLLFS